MKKSILLIAAALLLSGALTACGMTTRDGGSTTSSTRGTTETRTEEYSPATDRDMSEFMHDNAETVSEMFSEGASELRENSFLDPQNGIISDTQPNG